MTKFDFFTVSFSNREFAIMGIFLKGSDLELPKILLDFNSRFDTQVNIDYLEKLSDCISQNYKIPSTNDDLEKIPFAKNLQDLDLQKIKYAKDILGWIDFKISEVMTEEDYA